ncbi:hypothetical protein J6590_013935 [Homalodisca vitripennis]|nr:hypothetical protein J6590_013935 [Homalodisca vitripennis]
MLRNVRSSVVEYCKRRKTSEDVLSALGSRPQPGSHGLHVEAETEVTDRFSASPKINKVEVPKVLRLGAVFGIYEQPTCPLS